MTLAQKVAAQVSYMDESLVQENQAMLDVVCQAAVTSLQARLRDDVAVEDCQADFVTAAGMLAVAALTDMGLSCHVEQFSVGDVTVRPGPNGKANFLRQQAQMLMKPYLKASFVFVGV